MAFFAYLMTSLIEYFEMRRKIGKGKNFWYPRLLSTIIVPWSVILVWYLVPALWGKVESPALEILWAIFSAYSSGVVGGIIETNIEKNAATSSFKIIIMILLSVSVFLYIWFTYKPPWIDLFINPEVL